MVPAAEALALGLVDRVVPANRLASETRALAATWAAFPPLALRRAKEAIQQSERASLAEILELEVTVQHELFATPEARERLGQSLIARSR